MGMSVRETIYPGDSRAPVIASTARVQGAHHIAAHRHDRAQLIHCLHGHLNVHVEGQSWLIGSATALWVPPGVLHHVCADASVQYLSLFIEAQLAQAIAAAQSERLQCVVMQPLLRELIRSAARSATAPASLHASQADRRLLQVIVDQLYQLEAAQQVLPLPLDRRLSHALSGIMQAPARSYTAQSLAQSANMSLRTLERIFLRETGLSFCQWQQRRCVIQAIELLQQGQQVKQIAAQLGYDSSSAFIAMFKRSTQLTPTEYLARHLCGD